MNQVTVYVDPVGCSTIGWMQAAGMPGDTKFLFKTPGNIAYPGIAEMRPQLVLRPHTQHMVHAYDINIHDPVGSAGIATIPGSVMNDRFNIEVYERNEHDQPQRMLACGKIDISGRGYNVYSPLGPSTFSIGPAGPAGVAGAPGAPGAPGQPGARGSRWYSGAGAPSGVVPDDRVEGDMYLDETTADVWRWNAATARWASYRGG